MRAAEIAAAGIGHLKLVDKPVPEPGRGEAQVRIRAATLNYRDVLLLKQGNPQGTLPYIPLSCACGDVTALGSGVTRVRVGERVMPSFFQNWLSGPSPDQPSLRSLGGAVDGVARDYACFPEDALVKVPDVLGDLEAATLPCAGVTAWNALFVARATKPGDVVVLMGTGGVSVIGLQLAKAAGATVIITSSSDAKLARARALGADMTLNYRATPEWGSAVRALAGGRGADVVLEVGGAQTLPQSSRALRTGGDIAAIGLLTGTPAWQAKDPGAKILRIRVGSRDHLEDLARAIVATGIRPVVDRVYPLERIAEALEAMMAGRLFGKIGIEVAQ